jgi:hypothetical protein
MLIHVGCVLIVIHMIIFIALNMIFMQMKVVFVMIFMEDVDMSRTYRQICIPHRYRRKSRRLLYSNRMNKYLSVRFKYLRATIEDEYE